MSQHRIGPRRRARFALLLLGASISMTVSRAASAQDAQGQGAAMVQFQTDAGCAAAAESWLIGMPNGTPTKEQEDTWTVWAFYSRRAQASAQAAGRPAVDGIGAVQAFVADELPHLKSPDAAEARKATAEAAAGTHRCAMRPEFQTRSKSGRP